jgi:hypothetical protein
MAGIGPNQFVSGGFPVTAGTTVNTQVSDLAPGTVGKINYIAINFAGHAAISVANGMTCMIFDASGANQLFAGRANRANAAALDIPGTNLLSLSPVNVPFTNGLSVSVVSANAGDSGTFNVMIGYDRTF